ncbi:hypothetical protein, unlikely [Trypanosoma brucei brucei TREU927]|uniref:Uncharacterized protein n=1 Tax=Trypanosoma brucei brucei (strain 927/4 GUTat10.1) TaxID=185431 RepID=Q4GYI0_TRYB2|nr:hypothetical protein, unlikely [Trypanosoma brucei brucei TREU927]CAJ16604.1 hypothetical protein, unlikely [Trypanosoma brucei brucei TREU927]
MTAWGPNTAEKKYFCIYDNTLIFVFLSFFFFFGELGLLPSLYFGSTLI